MQEPGILRRSIAGGSLESFAIDVAVASCETPVKVVCAYGLYVTVTSSMKKHLLFNVYNMFYLSQLGLFPAEKFPQVQVLYSLNGSDGLAHGSLI